MPVQNLFLPLRLQVTEEPCRSHTTSVGCTVQEDPRAQASIHGEERLSELRQGEIGRNEKQA